MRIVSWFSDPKFGIEYAHGPMLQLGLEEFRASGSQILKEHFRRHEVLQIDEHDVQRPFAAGESRKILKNTVPIFIYLKYNGMVAIVPQVFEQLRLSGVRNAEGSVKIELRSDCDAAAFKAAFDRALSTIV